MRPQGVVHKLAHFRNGLPVADDICVIKSMYADIPNHEPSLTMWNTGANFIGRPSMGSWITYGLGSESSDLPGFVVLVSGKMYTGRDAVHSYLMKHDPPVDLRGVALYHCGPVVVKEGDRWRVTAAGPTTSIREEPYQADIIRRYGVRAVVGKGGMGAKTLGALKEAGAVYLNAIGGAAQFYARAIDRVDGVSLMEFGTPEAMWHIHVTDFPAIVTMDAHGNSLHKDLETESAGKLAALSRA